MSSSTSLKDMYYVETAGLVAIPVRHTSTQPKATSFRDGKMNATQRKATEVTLHFCARTTRAHHRCRICRVRSMKPQVPSGNIGRALQHDQGTLGKQFLKGFTEVSRIGGDG